MIIFLNGTSSSGKSVIAREIMRQSEIPFLYYSIDHFVNFWIDGKFIAFEDEAREWFFKQHIHDIKEPLSSPVVEGPNIYQLHWDMIEAMTVLIKKGYDLIIDEVVWNSEIFEKFIPALIQSDRVYLISIFSDLIECERREKNRKDRVKGLTRMIYPDVYKAIAKYDLIVDTTHTPVIECAKQILHFIKKEPHPQVFLEYLGKK